VPSPLSALPMVVLLLVVVEAVPVDVDVPAVPSLDPPSDAAVPSSPQPASAIEPTHESATPRHDMLIPRG
jgi:hypothetical protein